MFVYETENYIVRTKESIGLNGPVGIECYSIINKKFNIVEAEAQMYIQAIAYVNDLQNKLLELREISFVKEDIK